MDVAPIKKYPLGKLGSFNSGMVTPSIHTLGTYRLSTKVPSSL